MQPGYMKITFEGPRLLVAPPNIRLPFGWIMYHSSSRNINVLFNRDIKISITKFF